MNMNKRATHATPQELIELLPYIHYFKWDKVSKDLIEDYAKPNAFERDGLLFISSEDTLNADLFQSLTCDRAIRLPSLSSISAT